MQKTPKKPKVQEEIAARKRARKKMAVLERKRTERFLKLEKMGFEQFVSEVRRHFDGLEGVRELSQFVGVHPRVGETVETYVGDLFNGRYKQHILATIMIKEGLFPRK